MSTVLSSSQADVADKFPKTIGRGLLCVSRELGNGGGCVKMSATLRLSNHATPKNELFTRGAMRAHRSVSSLQERSGTRRFAVAGSAPRGGQMRAATAKVPELARSHLDAFEKR